jgi:arginine decarboxylase-like protein
LPQTADTNGNFVDETTSPAAESTFTSGLFVSSPAYLVWLCLQEVMGSLHNLFGGLNVVHIRSKPKAGRAAGGYAIEHVVKGQTMEEVLRTVQYEGEDMMESLRIEAEEAVNEGRLTLEDASALLLNYNKSLKSYTYLKSRSQ